MQLILDGSSTIKTTTWEDYLYKVLRKIQEFEADVALNPYNFNNITSSETHDPPAEFSAEINMPCQIGLAGISSSFYLPVTTAQFTNGSTGELANLDIFRSMVKAILFLSETELSQFSEATSRFNWAIEKNPDRAVNNAIFAATITLPIKHEPASANGETFVKTSAKEIFF